MCCIIFSELKKTQRNVYRQSSDYHAKHIFTQRLVSGFYFITDFRKYVISAQKLSTKFGSGFYYRTRFFGNNFNKFLSEKNRGKAFSVSSENMLHTVLYFHELKNSTQRLSTKFGFWFKISRKLVLSRKVWFQVLISQRIFPKT